MSDTIYSGGCLCGAVRYEARGEPTYMGYCFCPDCRKASGSGFIPFMGFPASVMTFKGETLQYRKPAESGRISVRNSCPNCAGLVFGGEVGISDSFTIYAGSLDDARLFKPTMAIFTRDRPDWALMPPGLVSFEGLPS
jgi:hypothetical protein